MDHSRTLRPVLATLPERHVEYAHRLLLEIEADPRFAEGQNLLYALLARVLAGVPPELNRAIVREELAVFFTAQRTALAQAVYDPAFVTSGGRNLDPLAERFLGRIVDICLDLAARGEIGDAQRRVWRFDGDDSEPFPYDETASTESE